MPAAGLAAGSGTALALHQRQTSHLQCSSSGRDAYAACNSHSTASAHDRVGARQHSAAEPLVVGGGCDARRQRRNRGRRQNSAFLRLSTTCSSLGTAEGVVPAQPVLQQLGAHRDQVSHGAAALQENKILRIAKDLVAQRHDLKHKYASCFW